MSEQIPDPSPSGSSLRSRLKGALGRVWEDRARLVGGLLIAAIAFQILRGCVPALNGNHVPAALETAVTEAYVHCDQDFPIWPSEVRMPTCDSVQIRSAGAGTVPQAKRAGGITRAVCYHVDVEHLFWGEGGPWKHEMAWALRTYSKVAVLQDGEWVLYPEEDETDGARWAEYQCPGEYEASSGIIPRRS